jgi:hypothetical protein
VLKQPEGGVDQVFDLAGKIAEIAVTVLGDLGRRTFEALHLDGDLAELLGEPGQIAERGVTLGKPPGVMARDVIEPVQAIRSADPLGSAHEAGA